MTTVIAEMTRGEFELTRGLEVLSAVQFRNSRISSREDVKKYKFRYFEYATSTLRSRYKSEKIKTFN